MYAYVYAYIYLHCIHIYKLFCKLKTAINLLTRMAVVTSSTIILYKCNEIISSSITNTTNSFLTKLNSKDDI